MQERTDHDPGGDYSYDLVHEGMAESEAATKHGEPPRAEPPAPDDHGDYSYDLAHDIPPAGS